MKITKLIIINKINMNFSSNKGKLFIESLNPLNMYGDIDVLMKLNLKY